MAKGMLSGSKKTTGAKTDDTMYAGGSKNFDETAVDPAPVSAPAPEPESEMTFTFIEGSERGDARPGELWGQTVEPKQVTEDYLREYFNDPKRTNRLPEVFGTFENYLAYMTEREQLLQSGELTLGDWGSAANITGPTETITLPDGTEVEIPAIDIGMGIGDGGELGIGVPPSAGPESTLMLQQGAYDDWLNSEVNQALLQKYGVNPTVYSETGDKFQWNGSSYVKIVDVKNPDIGDFVVLGMQAFVGAALGGAGVGNALSTALGLSGTTAASVAGALNAVIGEAATSILRGESIDLDIKTILASAVTQGLLDSEMAQDILDNIPSTGISSIDQALRAGVVSSAMQLAVRGEIDLNTLAREMLQAGFGDELDEFLSNIKEAAGLQGEEFEKFLKELQERFPNVDAGILEDAIRDLADELDTREIEEVLSSIANRAGQGWEDFKNYLEAEKYTIEDFDFFEKVLKTIGKAIPKDLNDLKALFKSIVNGMNPFSVECVGATTRVTETDPITGRRVTYDDPNYINQTADRRTSPGGWTGKSVVYDMSSPVVTPTGVTYRVADTYDGWMDCVNLRGLLTIPGLDIPMPPGLSDISIADLRKAVMMAGDSFEDFLADPGAWLEGKIKDIIDGITEPFENPDALLEYLGSILGGVLAGALYDEIKDRLEGEVPDLFLPFTAEEEGNDCTIPDPEGGPDIRGKVKGGQCVALTQEEIDKIDAPLGRCQDGTPKDDELGKNCAEYAEFDFCSDGIKKKTDEDGTNCDDYEPPFENNGPTRDDCKELHRSYIPANPSERRPSECGGCLSEEGFDPDSTGGCTNEAPVDCSEQGEGYTWDDLKGECVPPNPDFNVGDPCKTEDNLDGRKDKDGVCIADPVGPQPGDECTEGDQVGTIGPAPDFDCIIPDDTVVEKCTNRALNFPECNECPQGLEYIGEECVEKCLEGYTRIDGKCTPSPVKTCDDPKATKNPDGTCGPCEKGYERKPGATKCTLIDKTIIEECPDNTFERDADGNCVCPEGTTLSPDGKTCVTPTGTTKSCEDDYAVKLEDGSCGPCINDNFVKNKLGKCVPIDSQNQCDDPNATKNIDGSCGPCEQGFELGPDDTCVKKKCRNGATDYPLCTECPDGTSTDPDTPCKKANPCDSDDYARANPIECGKKPNPCDSDDYARANPIECGKKPNPCDSDDYAAANPIECGKKPNPCDSDDYARANPIECGKENKCDNGAVDYPICTECPDGSLPDETFGCGGSEECPEGQVRVNGVCVPMTTTTPPVSGGSSGGGGGGGGRMLSLDMGVAYSPQQFTAVEYQSPTRPVTALKALNQMIERDVKKGLFSL